MKGFKFLSALVISASIFTACKDTEEVSECDLEGLACTDELVTKTVSVKTGNNAVQLDSISVEKSDGTLLFSDGSPEHNTDGTYKLISDSEMSKITKEGTDVTFYGFINNEEVVNEDLRVGHNCCHVVYISGLTDISVSIPD